MPQPQTLTRLCSNLRYITALEHWCGEKVYMLQELELVSLTFNHGSLLRSAGNPILAVYSFKILANIYVGLLNLDVSGVRVFSMMSQAGTWILCLSCLFTNSQQSGQTQVYVRSFTEYSSQTSHIMFV